jgi:hypothetical protein
LILSDKHHSFDVRGDRIPILSTVNVPEYPLTLSEIIILQMFGGESIPILSLGSVPDKPLTESELCPPGPFVTDPIKKDQMG